MEGWGMALVLGLVSYLRSLVVAVGDSGIRGSCGRLGLALPA